MSKQSQVDKVLEKLRAELAVIQHAIDAIEAQLRERPKSGKSGKPVKLSNRAIQQDGLTQAVGSHFGEKA